MVCRRTFIVNVPVDLAVGRNSDVFERVDVFSIAASSYPALLQPHGIAPSRERDESSCRLGVSEVGQLRLRRYHSRAMSQVSSRTRRKNDGSESFVETPEPVETNARSLTGSGLCHLRQSILLGEGRRRC
jgi:hypothetical protein